ncbi:capsule biosynthesis protein [Pseudooceanicola algae]|uniref:Uncharacterized protein n=1 Tax=Pseudooceanicola algae TaxID=1537215 RepID=A0A7T1BR29_9RHOB|nr:capsule biosynthesis protein [Pseudooceanicola algae]QPM88881.1 hypothetical protein PSAL_000840 [Pseudooceanicola algae]
MPDDWDPDAIAGPVATEAGPEAPPPDEAPESAPAAPTADTDAGRPPEQPEDDDLRSTRRGRRKDRVNADKDAELAARESADRPEDTLAETAGPAPAQAASFVPLDSGQSDTAGLSDDATALTSRQLRALRRAAQKHGVDAETDEEILRILRARGIDPFDKDPLATIPGSEVPPGGAGEPSQGNHLQLPQAFRDNSPARYTPGDNGASERRQREIMAMQRDIARRRRRKSLQLITRLSFFIMLPTLLAGYYYYFVATPMYSTKSEFMILQADGTGIGGASGLFSGTQFATNQDAIAVQSFLESKDAMLRLDDDLGFRDHFEQDWIDPIQRLPADASQEQVYKIYKRYVKIGYDPSEGVIRMEIMAADPELATLFSTQLIQYAEKRVDDLSLRKREDAMGSALSSLEEAKDFRRAAQLRLVTLQEGTIVDPDAVIASLRTQISTYEVQLQEKKLQLAALNDNARPNQARVDGVNGDISRLETVIAELNLKMTDAQIDDVSLAAKTTEVRLAQADLSSADIFLQAALENQKQAELEANRQVRYLTTSVRPVTPEDPSYPRAFENTLLVMVIMSGVYLMFSLTAAILKEQVSN